jgi:hypothetical protein
MRKVTVTLESISPYVPNKYFDKPRRKAKESLEDYEKRIWKERCYYDESGHVLIPPHSFKRALQEAAEFLRVRIAGYSKEEIKQ